MGSQGLDEGGKRYVDDTGIQSGHVDADRNVEDNPPAAIHQIIFRPNLNRFYIFTQPVWRIVAAQIGRNFEEGVDLIGLVD